MRYWPLTAILLAFWLGRETGAQGGSPDVIRARRFELAGPQGLPRGGWYVNDDAETVFEVGVRNGMVRLVAGAGGDARVELVNSGAKSPRSASLRVEEQGRAEMSLCDGRKTPRVRLRFDRDESASVQIRDAQGVPRGQMKMTRSEERWNQWMAVRTGIGGSASLGCDDDERASLRLVAPSQGHLPHNKRRRVVVEAKGDAPPSIELLGQDGKAVWRVPAK